MRYPLLVLAFATAPVLAFACGGGNAPPPSNPSGATSDLTTSSTEVGSIGSTPPDMVGSAASNAPPASTSAAASAAPIPSTYSSDLPRDQKAAIMKTRVVPTMAPLFQAADAKRYADFSCKSCHGPEFKLPKDALPHLTMKGGNITAFKEKPQIAKFMAEKVVPAMASAMGLKPYDMKTHEGFGCAGCHAVDTK